MSLHPLEQLVDFPPEVLRAAIAWVQRSGWPARDDDLALAARLWADHLSGRRVTMTGVHRLIQALESEVPDADAQATHRRTLIRVVWRAAAQERQR